MKHLKSLVMVATSVVLISTACNKTDETTATSIPTVGNWVKRSAFDGNGRAGAASFVIDGLAYVATGYDGTQRYNDLWSFNPDTESWKQKASMPTAAGKRNSAVAFAIGKMGYIVGGATDGNSMYNGKLNDTWEYDAMMDIWTPTAKGSLPDPNATVGSGARYGAVGFAINGKGYICSGYTGSHTKDLYEFDGTNWIAKTSMPSTDKVQGATVLVYGSDAYIVTGSNNGVVTNQMWKYTPATDKWTAKRNITNTSTEAYDDLYNSITRSYGVGFVNGTKGYITTGVSASSSYNNTTWEYNFDTDLWVQKSNFERAERSDAVAFTVKGKSYVALGKNTTYYYDNVDEFQPDVTLNTND
jgi:Kelch motif